MIPTPSFPRRRESSAALAPGSFPRRRESSAALAPGSFPRRRESRAALAAALLSLAAFLPLPATARPLSEIKLRGEISLCANPDALPYASEKAADTPGFQIEIGRALAARLGVKLQVLWIIPRLRAGLVDCDMLLDTIADPATARGPVRLSQPYQKSGVALALRRGLQAQRFDDLAAGSRVGVLVNSLASRSLNQRGLHTVPYVFESELVADIAKGELDAGAVSPPTIAYFIQQHPDAGLHYTHAYDSEPELRWNLAVGLRRSDDALVEAVNAALAQLASDGTLAKIYARYGVDLRQP
jgi:ABC-type amino acid transport substrate-binding protein